MASMLEVAERRLDALIDAGDEAGWAGVARELMRIDAESLWQERGYHSFSAWLRDFAQRKGCSESLLWKYAKAGRAYERARGADPALPDMASAGLSSRTVATAEKICGDDAVALARMVGRVVSGDLRPGDVEDQWRAVRKVAGARKSRHDAPRSAAGGDAEMTRRLTAALARDAASWIWGAETPAEAAARKSREAPREYLTRDAVCVRTITEFPVRVEGAERARRVDVAAVCVENQTTADWMDVTLRGVEVKVSESDLGRDMKMGDYALFFDYMSIAVPLELMGVAGDAVPPDWGVLGYDAQADRVAVAREPVRLDAPRREAALMTAIVKMASATR